MLVSDPSQHLFEVDKLLNLCFLKPKKIFYSAKATASLADSLENYVHVLTLGKHDIYRKDDILLVIDLFPSTGIGIDASNKSTTKEKQQFN